MSKLFHAACVAIVLVSCGCAKTSQVAKDEDDSKCVAAAAAGNKPGKTCVNTVCPMVPTDAISERVTATYKGKTIAFCCPRCAEKFQAMDEHGKDGVLKVATTYAK